MANGGHNTCDSRTSVEVFDFTALVDCGLKPEAHGSVSDMYIKGLHKEVVVL